MAGQYYPPPAFYFTVTVLGAPTADVDASFQEISGIQAETQVEDYAEGGENRFVHCLPKQAKYSNLVLKRGAVATTSFFALWCGQTIGANLSLPVLPSNLLVTLLNENGNPLMA